MQKAMPSVLVFLVLTTIGRVYSQTLPQTISFGPLPVKTVGNADFALSATGGASGQPVTFTSSDTNTATVKSGLVHIKRAGATVITASQAGDANYVPATPVLRSLWVWSPAGLLAAWGDNTFGQATIPADLGSVVAIAASFHTVALKSNGTVVAWGWNDDGQTSIPFRLDGVVAIAAALNHTVALKSNGTVVAWGSNASGQTSIPRGLSGVIAISAGLNHTVALKSNGTVLAWGDNTYNQTTIPAALGSVVAIAAGHYYTVALKSDGTVTAWGANYYGQTTIPSGLNGVVAIAAGRNHTVALKSNGTVVAWGSDEYAQTSVPSGLSGVVAINAGDYHSVALKSNGTMVAWGRNLEGQITIPAGVSNVAAVDGGCHMVALCGSNTVSNFVLTPPSPAALTNNQSVTVHFSYSSVATSGARIWTLPYYHGESVSGGTFESSILLPKGSDTTSRYFGIPSGSAAVDSVYVLMMDSGAISVLFETFIPVQYSFGPSTSAKMERTQMEPKDYSLTAASNGTIRYTMPVASDAVIKLYTVNGRSPATLVNRAVTSGYYQTPLTAARGLYIVRMDVNDRSLTTRMVNAKQ